MLTYRLPRRGILYVGRGGPSGDPEKIFRVGSGGSPVEEIGERAIHDPDAVLFDADGTISGVPGSVLVAGLLNQNSGHITAVQPDGTVEQIFSSSSYSNPAEMQFDRTGRLVFIDCFGNAVFATGAKDEEPSLLFELPNSPAATAVDPLDRIYTICLQDRTIRVHDTDGNLLDDSFYTGVVPWALAIGCGGSWGSDLYAVSASTGDLLRFSLSSGEPTVIGRGFGNVFDFAFGPDGRMYVIEEYGTTVVQICPGVIPGDLDCDGKVNSTDLDIVRMNWGKTVAAGDLDSGDATGDGYVGSGDLDTVRGNWLAEMVAVPEPTTFVLVLLGAVTLALRKTRRPRTVLEQTSLRRRVQ